MDGRGTINFNVDNGVDILMALAIAAGVRLEFTHRKREMSGWRVHNFNIYGTPDACQRFKAGMQRFADLTGG
jgi:hypothetical protein